MRGLKDGRSLRVVRLERSTDAERLLLYAAGATDVEAAAALEIATSTYRRWRERRGLPAQFKPGGFSGCSPK